MSCSWEHALHVFAMAAGDRLRPETQKMMRQRLRRGVLAIIRNGRSVILWDSLDLSPNQIATPFMG
jgi:hypothetical protein